MNDHMNEYWQIIETYTNTMELMFVFLDTLLNCLL